VEFFFLRNFTALERHNSIISKSWFYYIEYSVVTLQTWQRSTSRVSRCSLCCATNGRGV